MKTGTEENRQKPTWREDGHMSGSWGVKYYTQQLAYVHTAVWEGSLGP